mmetsp:Transcript_9514/g.35390  ORF Transcript_9514/g.35390 Transcript_9514/m.35390 type:complete len:214 (+) Transcript_9514:2497-3138(+)
MAGARRPATAVAAAPAASSRRRQTFPLRQSLRRPLRVAPRNLRVRQFFLFRQFQDVFEPVDELGFCQFGPSNQRPRRAQRLQLSRDERPVLDHVPCGVREGDDFRGGFDFRFVFRIPFFVLVRFCRAVAAPLRLYSHRFQISPCPFARVSGVGRGDDSEPRVEQIPAHHQSVLRAQGERVVQTDRPVRPQRVGGDRRERDASLHGRERPQVRL